MNVKRTVSRGYTSRTMGTLLLIGADSTIGQNVAKACILPPNALDAETVALRILEAYYNEQKGTLDILPG